MTESNKDKWVRHRIAGDLDKALCLWYANRTRKGVDLRLESAHRILRWSKFPFLI